MGSEIEQNKFLDTVLQHKELLNKWIWIIIPFQNHCQLSKFTIQDMPFETIFISLVNTRGQTDSTSLNIIKITAVTLRTITDLKLFVGGLSQYENFLIFHFNLPYFLISNNDLFFGKYSGSLIVHRRSLQAFYMMLCSYGRHNQQGIVLFLQGVVLKLDLQNHGGVIKSLI